MTTATAGDTRADRLRARLVELVEADPRKLGDVAQAAGMSYPQLYQIVKGIRRAPSVDTVGAILEALGKRWRDLDTPRK